MGNLDLVQSDHHEGRLSELNQCISCRLNEDVGTVGNTGEPNLSERDVDIYTFVLPGVSNLLGERLELAIKCSSSTSLLLFSLKFFLVAIAVLAPAVSSLVKLHFSGLAIELDIPRLSLPDHDGGLQVHVDEHDQFVGTWLKEEMLDIAEKHIDMFVTERRQIAKTVLVDLHLSGNTFSIQRGSKIYVGQFYRTTV